MKKVNTTTKAEAARQLTRGMENNARGRLVRKRDYLTRMAAQGKEKRRILALEQAELTRRQEAAMKNNGADGGHASAPNPDSVLGEDGPE